MIAWKKTILSKNKTIYDAVKSLSKSELKIVLVTDKNSKLLGNKRMKFFYCPDIKQ